MSAPIEVSVICITYNHGELLRQSLDSIVGQETDFGFEVIVHDDCSTDGTSDILREYAERYPQLIVPLYETENQYKSGRKIVREIAKDISKGQYIAFCEGDDYWTDPLKLQKQYEAMQNNPQVDLCAGRGVVIDASSEKRIGWMRPKEHNCIIPVQDVIEGGGQYFATASLFVRSSVLASMPYAFEKEMEIDYVWQIKGALRGGACYIDQEIAAYRSGVEGAWSTRMTKDANMRMEHVQRMAHMLETLDTETAFQYHASIVKRIEMSQKGEIPFFEQLEMHKAEVLEELKTTGTIYLWGNGKRGMAFQRFARKYNIPLNGVCDAIEESIGETTSLGIPIVSVETAKQSRGIIVASNQAIYDALTGMELSVYIVNLQQYIKYE